MRIANKGGSCCDAWATRNNENVFDLMCGGLFVYLLYTVVSQLRRRKCSFVGLEFNNKARKAQAY